MDDKNDQKRDDLEEASKLEEVALSLTGAAREQVEQEAADLRARWQAMPEMVALAGVSADLREADLREAAKLEAVAGTLRPGAGRSAVEAEALALRAKWPDFPDDPEGQVRRLAAHLLSRAGGGSLPADAVPARMVLARLAELEAQVAKVDERPATCYGCGLPQPGAGPGPVNSFLVSAVRMFETDGNFRQQVTTGQVQAGQATHPWIPGAQPHKGPLATTSPWALGTIATMIKSDPRVAVEVGPRLRAALGERNLYVPNAPGAQPRQLN